MNDKIIKAIKKLKEGQDDIKLTYKDMLKKIDNIEKDLKNSDDLNTKELFSAIADNLARYTIQDGYWFYNGRSLGIRAEGIPGKDGKDGAPGKDAVDPIIKIGKVEEGEASVKLRKKDGVIYFDFKVPRGNPGFMGFDAKINGHNTIEIVEGENIEIKQEGKKLIIDTKINLNALEKTLQDILTIIQGGELDELTISKIEELIVSYFENKTVEEVEG